MDFNTAAYRKIRRLPGNPGKVATLVCKQQYTLLISFLTWANTQAVKLCRHIIIGWWQFALKQTSYANMKIQFSWRRNLRYIGISWKKCCMISVLYRNLQSASFQRVLALKIYMTPHWWVLECPRWSRTSGYLVDLIDSQGSSISARSMHVRRTNSWNVCGVVWHRRARYLSRGFSRFDDLRTSGVNLVWKRGVSRWTFFDDLLF